MFCVENVNTFSDFASERKPLEICYIFPSIFVIIIFEADHKGCWKVLRGPFLSKPLRCVFREEI